MIGLGTVVNCAAILLGCAVGLILKKGFPEKWRETIMYGVALSVFFNRCANGSEKPECHFSYPQHRNRKCRGRSAGSGW